MSDDNNKTKLQRKLDALQATRLELTALRTQIGEIQHDAGVWHAKLRELDQRLGAIKVSLRRKQREALDLAAEIPPLLHAEVSGFVGKLEPEASATTDEAVRG